MNNPAAARSEQSRPVVLSLKPQWVRALANGEKEFEYRRKVPRQAPPFPVVIYASSPVCALVATALVSYVLRLPPAELIERTRYGAAGEAGAELLRYFQGMAEGFAMRVEHYRPLDSPIKLTQLRALSFVPPQSFAYLDAFPALERAIASVLRDGGEDLH
jgi:predicted transcriptional regulator